MERTKVSRPRGRPRRFDPDQALVTAQRLFHARGYDAVSVADLTQALGINPPSFYAAFGSKPGPFDRVLDRYAVHGAIPLPDLLDANRPVADSLVAVLEAAARRYSADPAAAGCLVIEGSRCADRDAREATGTFLATAEDTMRRYIAARSPAQADSLTDYMGTVMTGLSANARNGHDLHRLLATVRLARVAIEQVLFRFTSSTTPTDAGAELEKIASI